MIRLTDKEAQRMGLTKKRSKYNAKITEVDGIKFYSAKEARYYAQLLLEKKANPFLIILRQVPFDLPGGVRYICDFVEYRYCWGCSLPIHQTYGKVYHVKFVDVKGVRTATYRIKKRQVEAIHSIKITEV